MSAKIRIFKLAEGSTWEAIDAQQRARCIPVLRLPQGDWAPQTTHSEQWVYSLANTGGTPSAEWFPCYFDVQSGRWVVIPTGGGLRIFRTPTGGIPAAVGAVWGSASCTEHDTAGIAIGSKTIRNHRTSIIPGNVFILAQAVGSMLFCVEGNCPTSGGIIEEP